MKTGQILLLIAISFLLASCVGPQKEVPPAYVGKISGPDGLEEGLINPSKFRLDFCFFWQPCDNLILVEASDQPRGEKMRLYIPQDDLNLNLDVRGTFTISPKRENVEKVFRRITAEPRDKRTSVIGFDRVYETYAQPVIRAAVRSTLTQYSIAEIMGNRESISQELTEEVTARLADTPITVLQFGLADIQPPEVILKAQEAAKEREIAIKRAEAEKQIRLTRAEADLVVAKQQQLVDLTEAETQVLVEKKLSESVSPAYVVQRSLRALQALAESDNRIVLLPMEALSNPALLAGLTKLELEALANSSTSAVPDPESEVMSEASSE